MCRSKMWRNWCLKRKYEARGKPDEVLARDGKVWYSYMQELNQ